MSFINTFVENYAENVITQHQFVKALNSNEGLANTVAEHVSVKRESPAMKKWANLVEQKTFAHFGRINEFQYFPTFVWSRNIQFLTFVLGNKCFPAMGRGL